MKPKKELLQLLLLISKKLFKMFILKGFIYAQNNCMLPGDKWYFLSVLQYCNPASKYANSWTFVNYSVE